MYGQLAPLVRNHMDLRYMVNPIAGFYVGGVRWRSSRFFKKQRQAGLDHRRRRRSARAMPGRRSRRSSSSSSARRRAPTTSRSTATRATPRRSWRRARCSAFATCARAAPTRATRCPACSRRSPRKRSRSARPSTKTCSTCCRPPAWPCCGSTTRRAARSVCDRVPHVSTSDDLPADVAGALCNGGECLDDALARRPRRADRRAARGAAREGVVLVMHQMGSHGPAYFKRSAPAQKRFLPECTNTTLAECDPRAAHQCLRQLDRRDRSLPGRDDRLAARARRRTSRRPRST